MEKSTTDTEEAELIDVTVDSLAEIHRVLGSSTIPLRVQAVVAANGIAQIYATYLRNVAQDVSMGDTELAQVRGIQGLFGHFTGALQESLTQQAFQAAVDELADTLYRTASLVEQAAVVIRTMHELGFELSWSMSKHLIYNVACQCLSYRVPGTAVQVADIVFKAGEFAHAAKNALAASVIQWGSDFVATFGHA